MNVHVIVDFMHIYYKYFFRRLNSYLPELSYNGTDTTMIYYPLKDIEEIRKNLEANGHKVTLSICHDRPSIKKEDSANEYKAGRQNRLTDEDFSNIDEIRNLTSLAGHNNYILDGYEADDLICNLVSNYKDAFDATLVYTNDKDLFVNIDKDKKVGIMRYKAATKVRKAGYDLVTFDNFEEYVEHEYGVFIPFNAIALFLSTAGDSADHIKGINKFGPKAFSKLITKIACTNKIDWSICGDYNEAEKIVNMCKDHLTDVQFNELIESFKLVKNLELPDKLSFPSNISTVDLRTSAYSKYDMKSLI